MKEKGTDKQNGLVRAKQGTLIVVLVTVGSIIFVLIGIGFTVAAFLPKYWDIVGFIFGVAFCGGGSLILYLFSFREEVEIDDEKVTIRSRKGEVISSFLIEDIEYFEEEEGPDNDGTPILRLYTKDGKEHIVNASWSYFNYKEVRDAITHSIKDREREGREEEPLNSGCSTLIGMLLFALGSYLMYNSIPEFYKASESFEDQTLVVKGTVQNVLEIHVDIDGDRWLPIYLDEYPDLYFRISAADIKHIRISNLVEEVSRGDSIALTISEEMYHKHIDETMALSFWDKHWNYGKILTQSIEAKGKIYLPLKLLPNRKFDIDILIGGLFLWVTGVYIIWGVVKPT